MKGAGRNATFEASPALQSAKAGAARDPGGWTATAGPSKIPRAGGKRLSITFANSVFAPAAAGADHGSYIVRGSDGRGATVVALAGRGS